MLEKLVPIYYSEAWEDRYQCYRNNAIQAGLEQAKASISKELFEKIQEGWFHDAYLMQINCNSSQKITLLVKKHNDIIKLLVQNITYFKCAGPIISSGYTFPYSSNDTRPIAQILDIWLEKTDALTIYILLDNERILYINSYEKIKIIS